MSASGLTLPVWVAAAARAAVLVLQGGAAPASVELRIPGEQASRSVPVWAAARLEDGTQALAITVCDPGRGLDLTRGLEIWVRAARTSAPGPGFQVTAGAGVGRHVQDGGLCISGFARELLDLNLTDLLTVESALELEVVLPRGQELALRTSNAAFGVVDGLALIGTQAEVQTSASPDQLELLLAQLRELASQSGFAGPVSYTHLTLPTT